MLKRVTLLVDSFNSLSQAIFLELRERGFVVCVVYAINQKQILQELNESKPDFVLAPFLTKYISREIYEEFDIFLFHPGKIGDRGAYSLEWGLIKRDWGAVWLKIDEVFDGGDIYAKREFRVKAKKKSKLYREEMKFWAMDMLDELLENIKKNSSTPQILNPLHKPFLQKDRAINWQSDTTAEIIFKVGLSDNRPGVLDNILGIECYLFGAWEEERIRRDVAPKSILAKRDGAICLKTIDGAVWITHLMEPERFKLPATYVLKSRLQGVKEERLPLIFDESYKTFYEISAKRDGNIAYLKFNFLNGAIRPSQAIELKYAIEYLAEEFEVIVLMGGDEFFSNGIDLNTLEDSKKQGEDGWSSINAINNLVETILLSERLFITSFHQNSGAGGFFLGLASDLVVARDGVVFNPHYKTLGLFGSEFHSYTLPNRVGKKLADEILDLALPLGAREGKKIGLVDEVFEYENYFEALEQFIESIANDDEKMFDILDRKVERIEKDFDKIMEAKSAELERIYPQFWDKDSQFHTLRREFVYKLCPVETPKRFKGDLCTSIQ